MAYINGKEVLFSPTMVMAEGPAIEVDQTFNPNSENAQSGKAVAEAISSIEVPGGGSSVPNVGKFIGEVIIDNDETRLIEWTECADGSPLDFDELFFVAEGMADAIRTLMFTTDNEYDCGAYNWSGQTGIGFNAEGTYYGTAHLKMIGGQWILLNFSHTTSIYAVGLNRSHSACIQKGKQRCTTSLIVGLGWGHFTSGTKIAVYGR